MVIAFFLFETFKEDVLSEVIPVISYATTVRRKVVDVAVKIVKTSHGIILKVTRVVMEVFKFTKLWDLSNAAPAIPPALPGYTWPSATSNTRCDFTSFRDLR